MLQKYLLHTFGLHFNQQFTSNTVIFLRWQNEICLSQGWYCIIQWPDSWAVGSCWNLKHARLTAHVWRMAMLQLEWTTYNSHTWNILIYNYSQLMHALLVLCLTITFLRYIRLASNSAEKVFSALTHHLPIWAVY